jgi:hypothetical protein
MICEPLLDRSPLLANSGLAPYRTMRYPAYCLVIETLTGFRWYGLDCKRFNGAEKTDMFKAVWDSFQLRGKDVGRS